MSGGLPMILLGAGIGILSGGLGHDTYEQLTLFLGLYLTIIAMVWMLREDR